MCQRSGTAWQKACTRPSGSNSGPIGRREHHARGPERQRDPARHHRADPDRVGRLVAAARHDRRAGAQPRRRGGRLGHDARHLRALERRRHPRRVDPERVEHHRRPVAGREVEQDRAGAVGLVEGVVAGQPVADVVLGQQDVGDARPDLGLVAAHPGELRRREPGQRVVAGDRDEPRLADRLADLVALGGRALVVPQDRRAQDLAGGVEQDEAVHLAREAHALDVGRDRRPRPPSRARWPRSRPSTTGAGPARSTAGAAGRTRRPTMPIASTVPAASRTTALVAVVETSIPRTTPIGQACRGRSTAQIAWLTRFSRRSWLPDERPGSMEPSATRASRSARDSEPPRIALPSSPSQPA